MISLWCRLTGGHVWSPPTMAGVSLCDRCGAIHFGRPSFPWEELTACLARLVEEEKITVSVKTMEQAKSEGAGLWERQS